MNISLILLIIFIQTLNPVQCINSTLECSSTNDPHMINFNKVPFEFHYGGIFPLYESIYVKVNAGFKRCTSSSKAFCNCLIEIELYTGEYMTVNNCFGIDSDVQSDTVNLDCSKTIQQSALFSESTWKDVTDDHQSFKCATTPTNSIAVRTTLPSRKNDVMVLIYKRANTIDQVKIYPSDNYAYDSMQHVDKSLCGNYTKTEVPIVETDKIKLDPNIVSKCDQVLVDDCVRTTLSKLKQSTLPNRVDKLVQDCALDAQIGVETIGMFQKQLLEPTIYEELVKNFKSQDCEHDLCIDSETYNMLKKMCTCKGKSPNKQCLIDKKCGKSFQLCV